jgi:hypothetical protein
MRSKATNKNILTKVEMTKPEKDIKEKPPDYFKTANKNHRIQNTHF